MKLGEKNNFTQLINALRPMMKGTRKLGEFTAFVIDLGLVPAPDTGNERTAIELRAISTWKGYANGSYPMKPDFAGELAGRWDEEEFSSNLLEWYQEPFLNELADRLNCIDPRINKGNVGRGLGAFIREVFVSIRDATPSPLEVSLDLPVSGQQSSAPYIDEKTNRLRLGNQSVGLPPKKNVPEDIQHEELIYVAALLHAYCEGLTTSNPELVIDDIPPRWSAHFQDQRKAFYSAEWVREASWSCVHDGRAMFDDFLDSMHAGVTDTNLHTYPNGVERLLATLGKFVAEFQTWIQQEFKSRFSYTRIDGPLGVTALTGTNGKPLKNIVQGNIGIYRDTDADVPEKFLYDAFVYDSPKERVTIRDSVLDEVVVYGKIPRRSIRVPVYFGGTTSLDFMYVLKGSDGKMSLNFVIETKDVDTKANLRETEQLRIKAARKCFESISGDNITVRFMPQLKHDDIVTLIKQVVAS